MYYKILMFKGRLNLCGKFIGEEGVYSISSMEWYESFLEQPIFGMVLIKRAPIPF